MSRRLAAILSLVWLLAMNLHPAQSQEPVTLTFATGHPEWFAPAIERYRAAHPDVMVRLLPLALGSTDQLALYGQALEAQSPLIDLIDVEITWPGVLAPHLADLNALLGADAIGAHFPALVEEYTVEGRLVALPYQIDAGALYYRPDLLARYGYAAPPATWDELTEMARTLQEGERAAGNPNFWGYVWQGERYETLVCNALEWHGSLVDGDGRLRVNTDATRAALRRAALWPGTISPPAVTAYIEEDSRTLWLTGNVAFMRNWTFAARAAANFAFDVAPLPAGDAGTSGGCLRGWALAVSRHTRHPDAAAALAAFLAGEDEQRRRALESSVNPTLTALYSDPDVLSAMPGLADLEPVFAKARARPARVAGPAYDRLSAAYAAAVHRVLTGEADPADALEQAARELAALLPSPAPDVSPTDRPTLSPRRRER